MVLTNAQTTDLFQNAAQMGITEKKVVQLGNEGITTIANLVDFEKYTIKQVADSIRRLGGSIPDPTSNTAPRATIPTRLEKNPRSDSSLRVK